MTVAQLFKIFSSAFYGTRRFIVVLQESASESYPGPLEFSPHAFTLFFKIRFNIISILCLGIVSGLYPSGFIVLKN